MSPLRKLLLAQTDYSAWATRLVLDVCSQLTPEQLDSELGASHSSVLRTLRHIHDGERVWLRRLIEVDNVRLPPGPAPEHSFELIVQSWPELWRGYREWIEAASEDELTEEISTLLPSTVLAGGAELRVPRWQIVLHAVNHSTFHRGQIITMLRSLGVTPPATDLTFYCLTL
jgi:uncharacterized damage-inducible protein DinB